MFAQPERAASDALRICRKISGAPLSRGFAAQPHDDIDVGDFHALGRLAEGW